MVKIDLTSFIQVKLYLIIYKSLNNIGFYLIEVNVCCTYCEIDTTLSLLVIRYFK